MNPIPVTKIIDIENSDEFKLHIAQHNGEDAPLDVYVRSRDEWVGWNVWGGDNVFSRKYIFSLIDFYHEHDMWLFGGIFEVLKREYREKRWDDEIKKHHEAGYYYEIKELDQYSDYVGRLKVKMERPKGRRRDLYLENHLNEMMISEILKLPYSGESFPGYENINHHFSTLLPIFKNEVAGWKAALENVKGVYVVMDNSNGKKYVGAAYGESGVWSRWSCYIETDGHAGNDALEKLIENKGSNYAHNHFTLSLLEYRSMKVDDSVIQSREKYWKNVFLSHEFGYNKN